MGHSLQLQEEGGETALAAAAAAAAGGGGGGSCLAGVMAIGEQGVLLFFWVIHACMCLIMCISKRA